MEEPVVLIMAFLIDLGIGDPHWMPHPVRTIGRIIERGEGLSRSLFLSEKKAGICLTLFVVGMVYGLTHLLLFLSLGFSSFLYHLVNVGLIFTTLSVRSLGEAGLGVYRALERGGLSQARSQVATLVGRDTGALNEAEVVRAGVESVAENTVDGVIAPLFYAFLGGAPLALAYKAINTLDSMVGYKNERYAQFGWASAKLDDLANFIPARIAGLILPLAAGLTGQAGIRSVKTILRDRKNHPSPNAGIPEAAVAGALGVQLGGLNYYQGLPSARPLIGDRINPLSPIRIKETVYIMYAASLLFVAMIIISAIMNQVS
ncbi:MAG: adenosylcobinamide-phosphate synthase CbiB [bacterium]